MNKTHPIAHVLKDIFVYGSLITLVLLLVQSIFSQVTSFVYLDVLIIFLFVAGFVKVILE
ncbi:MAG: hypothetical protein ACP5NV_06320 [Candidatus Woesearchaeota archaeon]